MSVDDNSRTGSGSGSGSVRDRSWFPPIDPAEAVEPVWMAWLPAGPAPGEPSTTATVTSADTAVADDDVAEEPHMSETETERRIEEMSREVRAESAARRRRRRRARVAVGVGSVAVVGGAVTVVALLVRSSVSGSASDSVPAVTASPTTSQPSAPPPVAQAWCPEHSDGARVSGAGVGDLTSPQGEIFWINHQMYVARDAHAARAAFAPDAAVASIEATQAAITAVPAGTQHCVRINALAADRFAVTVSERRPTGQTQVWDTIVTTGVQPDGRVRITSITAAGG